MSASMAYLNTTSLNINLRLNTIGQLLLTDCKHESEWARAGRYRTKFAQWKSEQNDPKFIRIEWVWVFWMPFSTIIHISESRKISEWARLFPLAIRSTKWSVLSLPANISIVSIFLFTPAPIHILAHSQTCWPNARRRYEIAVYTQTWIVCELCVYRSFDFAVLTEVSEPPNNY